MTRSFLSEKLRQLRTSRNLRQEDVARQLHIVRQTYTNYENGTRTPPLETLIQLADFYQVPIDFLLRENPANCLSMYPISDTEKLILTAFRSFPPLFKREYLEYTQLKSRIASLQKKH